MESVEINKNSEDFLGELGRKNLQIRLLGHCIICLRKVRLKRKGGCGTSGGDIGGVLPPEIAPESVVRTPGFLTTFNQVWRILQTKWKERSSVYCGNTLSEEIEISLENVVENDSDPTKFSFSRAPTICNLCCEKFVAVENLMKAVRQQVREISMILKEGRRSDIGGICDFERSLRESGLEENEVGATLHFVGIFGTSCHAADKRAVHPADSNNHDDGDSEYIDTSNIMKMECEEETGLGNSLIGIGVEDDKECHSTSSGGSRDDNDEDPDYVKSEEELEEDESEEEMELDDIDDNQDDPDYEMGTDPLECSPDKRKSATPRRRANQVTSRKQQEADPDKKRYVCTCGGTYKTKSILRAHMKNSNLHPDYTAVRDKKPFVCTCGRTYAKLKSLRDHMRSSKLHPDITPVRAHRQICGLCGEWIMHTDMLQHLTNHFNGQAEWVINCPNEKCRFMFVCWKDLRTHWIGEKSRAECKKIGKEKFVRVCESCGFRGTNMLKLKNHVKGKHENGQQEKNLKCPISGCEKMFCVKQSVQFHWRSIVTNGR